MDFFEFLFGKKEDKNVSSQSSSSVNNCKPVGGINLS